MKHRSWGRIAAWAVVAVIGVTLGGLGGWASFDTVAHMAETQWGWTHPWRVPLAVDLAILGFDVWDLILRSMKKRARWMPWASRLMITGTIVLNTRGTTDLGGIVSHALLPAIYAFVILGAQHSIRAAERDDEARPLTLKRWLLFPRESFSIWREAGRHHLSPQAVIDRRLRRALVRLELEEQHGSWDAVPEPIKGRYALGVLVPSTPIPGAPSTASSRAGARRQVTRQRPPSRTGGDASASPVTSGPVPPAPASTPDDGRWWPASTTEADYVNAGLDASAALTARGEPVNRDTLAAELRRREQVAGNRSQAGELVRRVKGHDLVSVPAGTNGQGAHP